MQRIGRPVPWFLVLIAALMLVRTALAAEIQPLFADDEPLTLSLRGPLHALVRDDGEDRQEWPFRLEIGDAEALDVTLRVRGNFRRQACAFPPLRLNVKRAGAANTVFAHQDKLKIVTHCKSGRAYQTNGLQEFAAYRILNLLTDASFRVRLARITYADVAGDAFTRYAFFIESPQALAARMGGDFVEPKAVQRSMLDTEHTTMVALFQYLIANTDYSPVANVEHRGGCCHNSKLISVEDRLYAIPYDFDFSGLVNAAYAGSNPIVPNEDVRKRVYLGLCSDNAMLAAALVAFTGLGPRVEAMLASIAPYPARQRERDMAYLARFFRILDDDPTDFFSRRCRRREAL